MIKIARNKNKLIIESNENVNYVRYIYSLLFALILFSGMFRVPWHSQLQCYKNEINHVDCQLTEFHLFNYKPTAIKINNLVEARKTPQSSSKITLIAEAFFFYFKKYYFNFVDLGKLSFVRHWDKTEAIAKINLFVKDSDSSHSSKINYQSNLDVLFVILAISLFFPALLITVTGRKLFSNSVQTIYQFDGDIKTIEIHQERNFLEDIVHEYSFAQIVDIKLELPIETADVYDPCCIIFTFDDNYKYKLESAGTIEDMKKALAIIEGYLEQYSHQI